MVIFNSYFDISRGYLFFTTLPALPSFPDTRSARPPMVFGQLSQLPLLGANQGLLRVAMQGEAFQGGDDEMGNGTENVV